MRAVGSMRNTKTRIPSLRSTLERYGKLTHFVPEIKIPDIERASVDMVRHLGLIERVTFTSFYFEALLSIKRESPSSRVGLLSVDASEVVTMQTVNAGFTQICPAAREVTAACVSHWKRLGLEVRALGVKDRNTAIAVRDAGVDGMTVGEPQWLR